MKLYDYFRSTASYRVRIALNLKGIAYNAIPIHLVNNGGEQFEESYKNKNPFSLVPTLETNDLTLTQSLAIIDYLEEIHPTPSLYPSDPILKAKVKSLALSIACDIHPLNNLRVLTYLKTTLKVSDEQKNEWYQHWILKGFESIETLLSVLPRDKKVCVGDSPTLADICLIPQVYNAKRFNCPLDAFPLITDINDYCLSLDSFSNASPDSKN
jgi:maleylacetoacetate isomerase